jgi:hypothetical protein
MQAIMVRAGKGNKDRVTVLPECLGLYIENQIDRVRLLHKSDIEAGYGEASLPYALARKYPQAPFQTGWQYVFPSEKRRPWCTQSNGYCLTFCIGYTETHAYKHKT